MSKKLLFILLFAGVSLANSTPELTANPRPLNPEGLVNNPFEYTDLIGRMDCYSGNGWFSANDFEATTAGVITQTTIWVIQSVAPSSVDLHFYDGGSGGPGSLVGIASGSAALTDTGYDNWGYDLYQCVITLDSDYAISAGYHWVTIDPMGGYYHWLASAHDGTWGSEAYYSGNGGGSWSSSTSQWGSAYEGFWVIESSESAIEEATWGQIKAAHTFADER